MKDIFQTYFQALREAYANGGTEHSGRTALENFLNAVRPEKVRVQHEPPRQDDKGSPDFKIMRDARIIGYIENKAPGENLDKVLKSAQIKKYLQLNDSLIITDYLQWIWLKDGRIAARETLAYPSDLQNKSFLPAPDKCQAVENLISGFFSVDPAPVGDIGDLAGHLAIRARLLRDALAIELARQEKGKAGDRLAGLYGEF